MMMNDSEDNDGNGSLGGLLDNDADEDIGDYLDTTFKVEEDNFIDLTGDIDEEINNLVKAEPVSSEDEDHFDEPSTSTGLSQIKEEPKLDASIVYFFHAELQKR